MMGSGTKEAILGLHAAMHDTLDVLLDHIATMPAELLARDVAGFGYSTVRDQLNHVFANEAVWIQLLQMQALRGPRLAATVEEFRTVKNEVMAATMAYLNSIDERQLDAELEKYPEAWVGPSRTPSFIVYHVITHAFHHKGQIVAMLRLLGYPAPDTDMQRG
jgi:uncharacterized damage-inducible protein DinB